MHTHGRRAGGKIPVKNMHMCRYHLPVEGITDVLVCVAVVLSVIVVVSVKLIKAI